MAQRCYNEEQIKMYLVDESLPNTIFILIIILIGIGNNV